MNAGQRIESWWRLRNRRERGMLAVMVAAVAAFAFWYGLLWPARSLRDNAREEYAAAVAGLRQVQSDAARLQALAGDAPDDPAAFETAIAERAAQAGIALSRQRRDGEGRLVVEMDAVDASGLFTWLDLLRVHDNLQPIGLTAEREGARLRATATFAPALP